MIAQQLLPVFSTLSEGARSNGLRLLLLADENGPTEQFRRVVFGHFPNTTEGEFRDVCEHASNLARVGKLAGPWGHILTLRGKRGESLVLDTVCS